MADAPSSITIGSVIFCRIQTRLRWSYEISNHDHHCSVVASGDREAAGLSRLEFLHLHRGFRSDYGQHR
jgi:hypothetical protein